MPDVSGPGGALPSAHPNLPATAGLDGFEYRTVAEAGLEHESAEASLLAALVAVLPDQVPAAQRGLVSGAPGICVPIASVSGTFLVQLFTGNRLAMFLARVRSRVLLPGLRGQDRPDIELCERHEAGGVLEAGAGLPG